MSEAGYSKFNFELIVTIVEKGKAEEVIAAACAAGAEGATVLEGHGSGIHQRASQFGITINPQKEIILTMVVADIRNRVLKSIAKAIDINAPQHGVSFVVDIAKIVGISHLSLLEEETETEEEEL